jgi:hypothetical protein
MKVGRHMSASKVTVQIRAVRFPGARGIFLFTAISRPTPKLIYPKDPAALSPGRFGGGGSGCLIIASFPTHAEQKRAALYPPSPICLHSVGFQQGDNWTSKNELEVKIGKESLWYLTGEHWWLTAWGSACYIVAKVHYVFQGKERRTCFASALTR